MTKLSRRVFLGSAPAAAAAAGVFGTFFSSAAEAAIKWDDTYNVIVIGAGGAGLSAAVSAKEAGCKKVVVLEKMMFAGGNTIRAGGGFNAAIKADYEKAGIKDSPELHAKQTLAAGDGRGDPVSPAHRKGTGKRSVAQRPRRQIPGSHLSDLRGSVQTRSQPDRPERRRLH